MGKTINQDRMIRVDGKDCFVEALCGMMQGNKANGREGKVVLQFVKYDKTRPAGQRTIAEIPIFINIHEFLVLADSIRFGTMSRLINTEKQRMISEGSKYANEVWKSQGGSSSNGQVVARVFRILPATASSNIGSDAVLLEAQMGPGKVGEHGLIIPQFDYKSQNFKRIMVPMKMDALKAIAITVSMYYQGMLAASWVNGDFIRRASGDSGLQAHDSSASMTAPADIPPSAPLPNVPQQSYQELSEEYDDMPFQ